jgi:hypothetical protein
MERFGTLVTQIIEDAEIAPEHIFHGKVLELAGLFRPTKEWNPLVVRDGQLVAAIELQSHVGPSSDNNFNNRTEEAMGAALDLWTAFREGAFNKTTQLWLGYLFLFDDCPQSRTPVRVMEPHFKVFREFVGAFYARRYEFFCRKLIRKRHYNAAQARGLSAAQT